LPEYTSQQAEPFLSFEGGIDRENARTFLDRTLYGAYSLYHAYEDAQNMVLQSATSGKHPATVAPDTLLDGLIAWPTGNVLWFGSYTYSTLASNVLTFATHLLIARDDGSTWRYDAGSPGAATLVRRGFQTIWKLWTSNIYDQWLLTFNGRDAPMKYGQHLNQTEVSQSAAQSQNEPRPFQIPLGAKLVTPFVNNTYKVAGESWVLGGTSSFVVDSQVPGGGARQGPETLQVAQSATCTVTYTASLNGSGASFTSRDLLNPPPPYTATPAFTGSDFLIFQYFKPAGAATFTVDFGSDNTFANYFRFTVTPTTGSWQTARLARSTAAVTGAPVWNTIGAIRIINNDVTFVLYIDDMYMLYGNAPPAAQLSEVHKFFLVVGGVPTSTANLLTLFYSNASMPDYFPATNTQVMSNSVDVLAKTSQITAMKEYADQIIIGLPNAILSWTIGSDSKPVKSTITTVFGIDAARGVVETPTGSLIFPWQRGFYMIRATGRQYSSAKITPLLANMATDDPSWTMGIVDDQTKSVRYWFREGTSATRATNGVIYDYVRAQERGEPVWPSTMSQIADYATEAYVNGNRVVLYSRLNSPQIFVLGGGTSGSLTSWLTLPWMSRTGRDKLAKAIGLTVPISTNVPVSVQVRYAQHPGEFDLANWTTVDTIQPNNASIPVAGQQTYAARVNLGSTSRWFQVRFLATQYGFEIFPPVEIVALETLKQP
jgi:hypothetical protein